MTESQFTSSRFMRVRIASVTSVIKYFGNFVAISPFRDRSPGLSWSQPPIPKPFRPKPALAANRANPRAKPKTNPRPTALRTPEALRSTGDEVRTSS